MKKSIFTLGQVLGLALNLTGSILVAYSSKEESGLGINGSRFSIGVFPNSPHLLSFEPEKFHLGIKFIIAGFIIQLIAIFAQFLESRTRY